MSPVPPAPPAPPMPPVPALSPRPPQEKGVPRVFAWAAIVLGGLYLLNPGWGVLEFIPDVVPVFGNLDEAGATALAIWGIQALRSRRRG